MSIKDRLAKKTEGLFQPPAALTAAPSSVVEEAPVAPSPAPTESSPPEQRMPRTGPGQMLAFRSHMQESNQRVQELQQRLDAFDGAQLQRQLDPHKVRPSHWANRHKAAFTSAAFETLKLDIQAAGGNVQPIRVRPVAGSTDEFEIVFGHRRHRACLELGIPVTAVIHDIDDFGLFAAMDRENRERQDLSPFEQGEMYRRALDEGLFGSLRQMASALGVDAGNVSKAMAIARLPREVIDAFENPLLIQFRWGQQLHQAVQKDPEGVITRAKAIRQSPKRMAASEVVSRLVNISKSSKSSMQVFKLRGKTVGSLIQTASGAVKLELIAGALAPAQIVELVTSVESLLNRT